MACNEYFPIVQEWGKVSLERCSSFNSILGIINPPAGQRVLRRNAKAAISRPTQNSLKRDADFFTTAKDSRLLDDAISMLVDPVLQSIHIQISGSTVVQDQAYLQVTVSQIDGTPQELSETCEWLFVRDLFQFRGQVLVEP